MKAGPMMILIAGPYRSGTGDDPALMENNLRTLEGASLPLYRAGHIPLIGEWLALPLPREAGSERPGDRACDEIVYPSANRLLQRCDGVLRLPGASKGADEDVRLAVERGLQGSRQNMGRPCVALTALGRRPAGPHLKERDVGHPEGVRAGTAKATKTATTTANANADSLRERQTKLAKGQVCWPCLRVF